ncbi:MAG TPA: DUF2779 domain-containing protein [Gemmatimonadaceae bacterium]|nr:DUF2779 domain-containing protein [Gemmatimonadaceae bacterium]
MATVAPGRDMAGGSKSSRTLSKSDFALARSCDAKLYFRENRYPDNRAYDPYLQLLADGGFMVEALARAAHPDGIHLEYGRGPAEDGARTLEYLRRDEVTLFQATLAWGRRLARADIIEKRGNAVRLLEVKAKSFDGAAHLESVRGGGAGAFRSKNKPYPILTDWLPKFEDVTFQALLLERLLPGVTVHPFLVLVDKSKRSAIDNLPSLFDLAREAGPDGATRLTSVRFLGGAEDLTKLDLLTEVDASAEVAILRAGVDAEASRLEGLLDAPFEAVLAVRGAKCGDCEFHVEGPAEESGFVRCWGDLAAATPHALELYQVSRVSDTDGTPLIESMVRAGKASLFDIPESRLVKKDGSIGPLAARQLRQIRHTQSAERWIGPNLRAKLEALTFPLHFIDFEVSRLALPYHANMRPYGQVVFQWSCHTVDAPGAFPRHSEWLNQANAWPNLKFARTLREAIGDADTVLAWSPFEGGRLKELAREHGYFMQLDPDLVAWVDALVNRRIFDLHLCATGDFYHPGMRGRTSIKVVLDALWKSDPPMREQFSAWTGKPASESEDPYNALPALEIAGVRQDVSEGTGAMRAYEAMMYGVEKHDEAAKAAWRTLLLQYCTLDTLSMVLIFEYWRRATGL